MKRMILTLVAISSFVSLAACGPKAESTAETAPAAAPAADMAAMDMTAKATMAKGVGAVTAVTADSITIDHAPIPEANWPAMTMAFEAAPELASSVKVGDKVAFDLKLKAGAGEITAISKQ